MTILSILNEIGATASKNEKQAILESHKENQTLRTMLKLCLDSGIVFGIKKIPEPIEMETKITLDKALADMSMLSERLVTGHAARDFLARTLGALSADDATVLRKVIDKKPDCGMSESTVNKVFGAGFILDEPYMRCSLVDEKTIKNITSFKTLGYAVAEVKMDGQYLNSVIVNDTLTCTSRSGLVHDFLGMKDEDMKTLADRVKILDPRFSSGVVFHGECLVLDEQGNILPRTTGNGIIQKAGKINKAGDTIITPSEAMRVVFVLWDLVPYDAYNNRIWAGVERKERRELLEQAIEGLNSEYVRMVEYRIVKTIDEAFDFNSEMMSKKEEGSVLKCEHGVWKAHTSPKQLKMKMRMEVDLKIIGFNEGDGKRKGMLGSLILESADGLIVVGCGTGFKEKDHEWTFASIWAKRDFLLGKICCIETTEITRDKKTGALSLFIPSFVEFRFDKEKYDDVPRIHEIREMYIELLKQKMKNLK